MIDTTLLPADLTVGKSTKAVLRLHNISTIPCITVVLEFEPPRSLILERGRRTVELDRLNPGSYHDHPVRLQAVEPGPCKIAVLNFSFRDANGRAYHEDDRTIDLEVHPAPCQPAPAGRLPPRRRSAGPPSIFISHRRSESRWFVDLFVNRLREDFPGQLVFVDQDAIRPGEDFVARLDSELQRCAALLALIGPDWSGVMSDGKRRIDSESDFVRREIAVALKRGILVVPVLFDGAGMPRHEDLPGEIRALANRNAKSVDQAHFGTDVMKIVYELRAALGQPGRSGRPDGPPSR
jgi:hypothetical protein